jgi:MoaA/NifB/PqqE/SkfB family radical SAM enzyme
MATVNQKIRLLQGLFNGEIARTGPFFVNVDLTSRCNLRCAGCVFHTPYVKNHRSTVRRPADLPIEIFRKLCSNLSDINTNSMIIQGEGEPMLHPDVFRMIDIAKQAGLQVTMLTNGTLLNSHTAREIIDSRLDIFRVSLWAGSEEEYEKNYPGSNPANFKNIINGLKLLSRLKAEMKLSYPEIIIYYVINHHNFKTINRMVDVAYRAGCDGLFFTPMYNVQDELDNLVLSDDEERVTQQCIIQAGKQLKSLSMHHNTDYALSRFKVRYPIWQTHPCYIAWFHARITCTGMVMPCARCNSSINFGDLQNQTFKDIWNGPPIRSFRRQTLTQEGLKSVASQCECTMCCFFNHIFNVHKYFKLLSPFARF